MYVLYSLLVSRHISVIMVSQPVSVATGQAGLLAAFRALEADGWNERQAAARLESEVLSGGSSHDHDSPEAVQVEIDRWHDSPEVEDVSDDGEYGEY